MKSYIASSIKESWNAARENVTDFFQHKDAAFNTVEVALSAGVTAVTSALAVGGTYGAVHFAHAGNYGEAAFGILIAGMGVAMTATHAPRTVAEATKPIEEVRDSAIYRKPPRRLKAHAL